jgi:hypothetical protein
MCTGIVVSGVLETDAGGTVVDVGSSELTLGGFEADVVRAEGEDWVEMLENDRTFSREATPAPGTANEALDIDSADSMGDGAIATSAEGALSNIAPVLVPSEVEASRTMAALVVATLSKNVSER